MLYKSVFKSLTSLRGLFSGYLGAGRYFVRAFAFFAFAVFVSGFSPSAAFAAEVNEVAQSMVSSASGLPGLLAALSYLMGLILGITGLLKLKDHVENPTQTPLKTPLIRLLVGGAMLALPMIFQVVRNTIGHDSLDIDPTSPANSLSEFLGDLSGILTLGTSFNSILEAMMDSTGLIPGLITAVSYLLGLVITTIGVLKLKDHVEMPEQVRMKEGVIRLLIGGALFAMPTIYNAMYDLVGGNDIDTDGVSDIFGAASFLVSAYAGAACNPVGAGVAGFVDIVNDILGFFGFGDDALPGGGASLGDSICGIVTNAGLLPAFLTFVAYLIGLVFGVWGILKIRDHVLDPRQTNLWEGLSRLIAGGLFFALPMVIAVLRDSLGTAGLTAAAAAPLGLDDGIFGNIINAGWDAFNGDFDAALNLLGMGGCGAGAGLDGILVCLMQDVMAPIHVVLNFFAFCAGTILIMIGISRLIKSAQDGPRGPGGLGTITTFVVGGALISYNELVRAATSTLFGNPRTAASSQLQYTDGLAGAEIDSAHAVIDSVVKFMILVGLISFVRGLFILRSVAEGNQQASMMAGVTHVIAGAVAVNIGPLINAVESTLGLTAYGIAFS